MNIPYYHVDAFTENLFSGNPAGVCVLDSWLDDSLLQKIAAENNLSETAFVVAQGDDFALRWFTPSIEIDLCGHATLAAAFVIDLTGRAQTWPIRFATTSGRLTVDKEQARYFLDFPARPGTSCSIPSIMVQGLGAVPGEVLKARDYMAVFEREEQVANITPDLEALAELDCLGIIATAPGREVDFVSRFFAPRAGVAEDPVTGSAHCTLIPYWAKITGKQNMIARQLSNRGGELLCENKDERVRIGGYAVLYHSGTLRIPY